MILQFAAIIALFPIYLCFASGSAPKNNIVEEAQTSFDALCARAADDVTKITFEEYENTVQKLRDALKKLQSQCEKENTPNNIRGSEECAADNDKRGIPKRRIYNLFLYKLYDLSKKGKYGKEFLNQDGFDVKSFEELKRDIEAQ